MDGVDTSIYKNIVQPNPLQTLSSNMSTIGQLNQNKLFQQEFQARQGIGAAAQASINPDTGNFDPQVYGTQLANNKKTAFMAMEGYKQGLAAQQAQIQNQLSSVSLLKQKNDLESAALYPLLNNPALTKNDIHRAAADVVIASMDENGKPLISASDVMDYFGSRKDPKTGKVISPGLDDIDDNPIVLNNFAKQRYAQGQAIAGHLDNATKALYSQSLAFAPEQEIVGQVPTGTTDDNGQPVTRPGFVANANATPSPTVGNAQAQGAAPQQGAVTQGPPTPMKASTLSGAFTGGAQTQPQQQTDHTPIQGQTAQNPVMLSMPPGQEGMLDQTGGAAGKRVNDTIAAAQNAPVSQDVNRQVIKLASDLGSGVGPTATGVTETLGKLANSPGLAKIPGLSQALNGAQDNASKLMELKKFLLRTAQLRSQSLGLGTDFQQGMNVDANPNDKQFPQVIQQLAKYNLALDYIDQGKANALQKTPGATSSPAANEQFENKFRNNVNVNVYRALLASPQERNDMYKNMSDAQKTELKKDLRNLNQMGAIPQSLLQTQGQ